VKHGWGYRYQTCTCAQQSHLLGQAKHLQIRSIQVSIALLQTKIKQNQVMHAPVKQTHRINKEKEKQKKA
jgi:hypothetical protein